MGGKQTEREKRTNEKWDGIERGRKNGKGIFEGGRGQW